MTGNSRLPAVLAYIPVIGWLYVLVFQRNNVLAMYHLRQSIGLVVYLAASLVCWAVIAWILAWIPYMAVVSVALFSIVIMAWLYGIAVWVMGLMNALRNRLSPLPVFGQWANRLPIK